VQAYLKGRKHLVIFDDVDGAPAARFVQRLVDLIESGHGLDEALQDAAAPAGRPDD
jgi:hypothetical protein